MNKNGHSTARRTPDDFWQLEGGGRVIVPRLRLARGFWGRAIGLIGRRTLAPGEGLWIEPCRAIHTAFMRFPIDALFLSPEGEIVDAVFHLRPWRWKAADRRARSVVEMRAGELDPNVLPMGARLHRRPLICSAAEVPARESPRPE